MVVLVALALLVGVVIGLALWSPRWAPSRFRRATRPLRQLLHYRRYD